MTLAEVFVRAGLAKSRGEARRLAAQGGLYLDEERVADADAPFRPDGGAALLRAGKKRYRRVRVV